MTISPSLHPTCGVSDSGDSCPQCCLLQEIQLLVGMQEYNFRLRREPNVRFSFEKMYFAFNDS